MGWNMRILYLIKFPSRTEENLCHFWRQRHLIKVSTDREQLQLEAQLETRPTEYMMPELTELKGERGLH